MKINKYKVEKVYCVSRDEYEYEHDDMDCLFFINLTDASSFIQLNGGFNHRPDISENMVNLHRIVEEAARIHKYGDSREKVNFSEKYMDQKVLYFIRAANKELIEPRAGHITDINFTTDTDEHAFRHCIEVSNYSGTGGLMAFSIEKADENKDCEYELNDMLYKIKRRSGNKGRKSNVKVKSVKKDAKPIPKGDKVYFIQESNSRAIKIGKAVDPTVRLKQLQTGHPYELKILKVIDGGYEEERKTHKLFEQYKLSGEWFQCCDELMDYIDGLKSVNY